MLVCVFALGFSTQNPSFDAFLAKYNKVYVGSEYSERRAAYESALAQIEAHNAGNPSWTMKVRNPEQTAQLNHALF